PGTGGALRARSVPPDAARGADEQLPAPRSAAGQTDKKEERGPMSKLVLTTEGETHVVVKRRFEAPPEAVYRAHLDPELVQQWMLGPEGWTMPVCITEAKPGGKIRYEWPTGKGGSFSPPGEIIELQPPHRIV